MRSLLLVLILAVGCAAPTYSETEFDGGDGDGDAPSTGGAAHETGGSLGTGGEESATGGATGGASTGGSQSTGGAGTGGTVATGGSASTGGTVSTGGAPADSDGDGVPDSIDECPGFDDTQDLNENGEIDECEPGWCHRDRNSTKLECHVTFGARQGYCTMEFDGSFDGYEPGDCVQCPPYTYDCNEDWSDGCEVYTTGAHPCVP